MHRLFRPLGFLLGLGLPVLAFSAAPAVDPLRLTQDVVPLAQNVALTLDPARDDFSGHTTITLQARETFTTFRLHALGPTFTTATLTDATGAAVTLTAAVTHADMGLVTLTAPHALPAGHYRLMIDFTAPYQRDGVGIYKTISQGDAYLFTQFEETYARQAFPCWDEPAFKINWQLTLTVPANLAVVTNTPPVNETRSGELKTIAFGRTPPMPSYLVALAVGPLEFVPIPGQVVPGFVITPRGQTALAAEAVRMSPGLLARLEDYFGVPYPYAKLDHIAVPEYIWGAMENAGLITYTDRVILLDPDRPSFNGRRNLADIMAHEMGHMWFGNLVTMRWWDDIWLNESFADWICAQIVAEEYPEFRIKIQQSKAIKGAMRSDALPSISAVRRQLAADADFNQLFDELSYSKGKGLLNMVEHWIGRDSFQAAMRVYFQRHAWGNTTSDDLWAVLRETSGEDVPEMLSAFVNQPGLPLVTLALAPDGRLQLSQSRFHNLGAPALPGHWQVPVVLKWAKAGVVHEERVLLREDTQLADLPGLATADWIYPNAGENGYYRWSLSPELNARLARHSAALTPIERIGLLDNGTALFNAGLIDGTDYLAYLAAFGHDPDPDVCASVISDVLALRDTFVPADQPTAYHAFIRAMLRPMLDRIGLQAVAGEPADHGPLRSSLFGALGYEVADPAVVAECRQLADRILADPKAIDSALRSTVLRVAAYHGDATLLARLQAAVTAGRSPLVRSAAISALGRFHDSALARAALAWSLTPALNSTEFLRVSTGLTGDPDHRELVVDWVIEHYAEIAAKAPSEYTSDLISRAGAAEPATFERLRAFLQDPVRRTNYGDINIAKATDRFTLRQRLRAREQARVMTFIKTYPGINPAP